jgi:hypothetical protein
VTDTPDTSNEHVLFRPNSYIGRTVPRPNAKRLLSGRGTYTDDIKTMSVTPSVGDQDAYGTLNATLAYTTQNNKWRFALNGSNLTDEGYLQAGYDFEDAINYISQLGFYGAPRTWSVSATFTY